MNRTVSILLLVCTAAALDCWCFSGLSYAFERVEFTLCLVAALAVFAPEPLAAAAALAGGLILDSLGEKMLFLPLFFALVYCVRWIGGLFYKPGSVYHLAGSMLMVWTAIAVELFFIFMRTGTLAPLPAITVNLLLNSVIFLCLSAASLTFREEEKAQRFRGARI